MATASTPSETGTAPPEIPEVSFEEIQEGLQNGSMVLVDVRGREELEAQGEIPNSTNIPLPELYDLLQMLSNEEFVARFGFNLMNKTDGDKIIVFSCRSGKRAQTAIESIHTRVQKEIEKAGQELDTEPRPDIRLYRGSFLDWAEKGGQLIKR